MKDDKKKEDAERYSRSFDRDTPITDSADSTEPASEVKCSLNHKRLQVAYKNAYAVYSSVHITHASF